MKQCIKCKQILPLEMFGKDKSRKDGLHYRCKECSSKANQQFRSDNPEYYKQWAKTIESPYHIVYLIPAHNYVGVTKNPYTRMRHHHNGYKRNVDNWVELARYESRKEALAHESQLHKQGYNGAKIKNKKIYDRN
jgi:predicted GIY-YIG superfamily endonuclease/DNA-directed RNA polymerase subunit RPC12/RpoP